MSLRKMLRFWLAWLAPVSRPLPVVLALPAPVADLPPALPSYRWLSLEALVRLPTVEPARAGYVRDAADCDTVTDLTKWMVYERSAGWWRTDRHAVRTAAVYWLAMRERVSGVLL